MISKSKITISDKASQMIMAEFTIEEKAQAYEACKAYEEMGLDIEMSIPSVTQTLFEELGANSEELKCLKTSERQELENH